MEPTFSLAVVVDDDPDIALAARLALRDMFDRIETLKSPSELSSFLKKEAPDAILLDLNFERGATDGREGIDTLARIMDQDPDAAVVIITAHGAVSVAVEAIKRGAHDYLAKPVDADQVAQALLGSGHGGGHDGAHEAPDVGHTPPLRRLEWEHIQRVLAESDGNISEAARRLGLHRRTLQRKLAKRPVREAGDDSH